MTLVCLRRAVGWSAWALALALSPALADDPAPPPAPAWMARGLAAAQNDPAAVDGIVHLPSLARLMSSLDDPAAQLLVATFLPRLDPSREGDWRVRLAAVGALEGAPEGAWTEAMVAALLGSFDPSREGVEDVREAAAAALGGAPERVWTEAMVAALLGRLDPSREDYWGVREAVAAALGDAPERVWTEAMVAALFGRLDPSREDDDDVRQAAAAALGGAPERVWTEAMVAALLDRLDPSREGDWRMRAAAATALGGAPEGAWTEAMVAALLDRLDPSREGDPRVWLAAVGALGGAPEGAWTEAMVAALLGRLDPSREGEGVVRAAAAGALGRAPERVWTEAMVAALLGRLDPSREDDEDVRRAAAAALGGAPRAFGVAATTGLARAWGRGDLGTLTVLARGEAAAAGDLLPLLHRVVRSGADEVPRLRAVAHVLGGGGDDAADLLRWVGRPGALPLAQLQGDPAAAHRALAALMRWRADLAAFPALADEVQARVGDIAVTACQGGARAGAGATDWLAGWVGAAATWMQRLPLDGPVPGCWDADQRALVADAAAWLATASRHTPRSVEIDRQLASDARAEPWRQAMWAAAAWVAGWAALILAFPRSPTVQALVLFHPWARKYLSLGVVPLLLALSPLMRRRLLAPFRDDLLGDARLEAFDRLGFFDGARVRQADGTSAGLATALDRRDRVVILRGEAGLGKTSALRWIARRLEGRVIVAYLHARDCGEGVAEAVVRRIMGLQDAAFVRGAIHAGTMAVLIDGLNEVGADIRETIRQFANDNGRARIWIATQPIQWEVPRRARVLDLVPLSRDEAAAFLTSRPVGRDPAQPVHGAAFATAVTAFLNRALDEARTPEDRALAEMVVSNPFDLGLAADLIAQAAMPSAGRIVDEAFRLADVGPGDAAYRPIHGQPFPLVAFGKLAVQMRLEDRNWLKPGEFEAERPCLLARKLIVQRGVRGADGTVDQREMFRHDRVWDFFIVAAFQADPALGRQHLGDARFRGAYLRIAETWAVAEARAVRDLLVSAAAQSNDNTLSNAFVRRLEARPDWAGARALVPA